MSHYEDEACHARALVDGSLSLTSGRRKPRASGQVQWVFWITGALDLMHLVTVNGEGLACSCAEFRHCGHERPCRHAYFLSAALAGLDHRAWRWVGEQTGKGFDALDRVWVRALDRHLRELDVGPFLPRPDATAPTVCTVCMEGVPRRRSRDTAQCSCCKQRFHKSCLVPWLKTRASCPNCRQPMHVTSLYSSHPRHPLRHLMICPRDLHRFKDCARVRPTAHHRLCRSIGAALGKLAARGRAVSFKVGRSAAAYARDYLERAVGGVAFEMEGNTVTIAGCSDAAVRWLRKSRLLTERQTQQLLNRTIDTGYYVCD